MDNVIILDERIIDAYGTTFGEYRMQIAIEHAEARLRQVSDQYAAEQRCEDDIEAEP